MKKETKQYIEQDSVASCPSCKSLLKKEDGYAVEIYDAVKARYGFSLIFAYGEKPRPDFEYSKDFYCQKCKPEHNLEFRASIYKKCLKVKEIKGDE